MKKYLLLLAAAAIVFAACDKSNDDDTANDNEAVAKADLVGVWESIREDESATLTFNSNGTYVDEYAEEGSWEIKDGTVLVMKTAEQTTEYGLRLIGGKAVLVATLSDKYAAEHSVYYKKGATIKSGALKDGRYDAPHSGVRGDTDYTLIFLVKGNSLEMYVTAWGAHFKGTYTIANGVLNYSITQSWQGQEAGGGWFAGEAGFDPETFTFSNPNYSWMEGSSYINTFSTMRLCVSDDGQDVFGASVGLCFWMYKR